MTEILDAARWPLDPTRDTDGGGEWAVEGEELENGVWVANLSRADELGRWTVRFGELRQSDLDTLRDFFRWTFGPFRGFRFPDPADRLTCASGATPAATDQTLGVGDGARVEWRLTVSRTIQSFTYTRRVWRPRAETVLVAVGGAPVDPADYTLDPATGVLTFDAPPPAGEPVSWGGAFDKAARFASPGLRLGYGGVKTGTVEAIELREIRETTP